jgi:hypothetical protein
MGVGVWIGLAGLAVGVIGIVLYVRGKREKRPRYTVRSTTLVEGLTSRYSGLEMRFGGDPISNLTSSRLALWNAGRETIQRQDLAAGDPTRVELPEGVTLLDVLILHVSTQGNEVAVEKKENILNISFEYIDHDQGAVLQLLHDGLETDKVRLLGSVKGAGTWRRRTRVSNLGFLLLSVFLVLLGSAITLALASSINNPEWLGQLLTVVGTWPFLILFIALQNWWAREVPAGFKAFQSQD